MGKWTSNMAQRSIEQAPNSSSSVVVPIKFKVHRKGLIVGDVLQPDAGDQMRIQKMPGSILYTSVMLFNSPDAPWSGGNVDIGYERYGPGYDSTYHTQPNGPTNFDVPDYFAAGVAPAATRTEALTGIWKPMCEWQQSGHDEHRSFDHWLTLTPAAQPAIDDELCLLVAYNIIG